MDLTSEWNPEVGTTSLQAQPSAGESIRPTVVPVSGRGLIAASGPTGLRFLQPDGRPVAELASGQDVSQPTWSRDGRRLVATVVNPSSGATLVAVVDVSTGEVDTSPASRKYFFYSWSHDGTRLAALGPGESGGTALEILDGSGMRASDVTLETGSVYVAWEPGGSRLLVHAGPHLWLIADPDSPQEHTDFGLVGFGFQAPAWVPGTHNFLYVDSLGRTPEAGADQDPHERDLAERIATHGPRLVRRSADNGEPTDLGDARGLIVMSVHPTGGVAALSLLTEPPVPAGDDRPAAAAGAQTAEVQAQPDLSSGAVWIVDLDTGERFPVLDGAGLWLEWSHDGRSLLIAAPTNSDPGGASLAWHVWDGQQTAELARFTPTVAFVRDYLPFADQYVETPRLWSPDSDAIVFGARALGLDTTAVVGLDGLGGVRSLGVADVSFWSPAALDQPAAAAG